MSQGTNTKVGKGNSMVFSPTLIMGREKYINQELSSCWVDHARLAATESIKLKLTTGHTS